MNKDILVNKYRPTCIENYIFTNQTLKNKVIEWCTGKSPLPHLGLFGIQGTGKTSLIHVIINELKNKGIITDFDVIILNMSNLGIEAVREKIINAVEVPAMGEYKIIVLEEMEQMSVKAQSALKTVIEDYHENAKFFVTSNEPQKILAPIISRLQVFTLDAHDKSSFTDQIINILLNEQINVSEESLPTLQKIIECCYPDMRKTLNTIEQSIVDNQIVQIDEVADNSVQYKNMIIEALQNNNIRQMRELIVQHIHEYEIVDFYKYLFDNVEKFSSDEIKQIKIKIKIRDALDMDNTLANREIGISALLCEIDLICTNND